MKLLLIFFITYAITGCASNEDNLLESSIGKSDTATIKIEKKISETDKKYVKKKARSDFKAFLKTLGDTENEKEKESMLKNYIDDIKEKKDNKSISVKKSREFTF